MLTRMTSRRIRVRSLTDRQLHEAIGEAFSAFQLPGTTQELIGAHSALERLLGEETRRLRAGRRECVCEFCSQELTHEFYC